MPTRGGGSACCALSSALFARWLQSHQPVGPLRLDHGLATVLPSGAAFAEDHLFIGGRGAAAMLALVAAVVWWQFRFQTPEATRGALAVAGGRACW